MSDYICPNCKNPIYDDDALLCHFCGESLQRASGGALGKMRYSFPIRFIFIGIVIVLLMMFVLLYIRR